MKERIHDYNKRIRHSHANETANAKTYFDGARSVARKCLTVVFDFTRKSRHTDDLKKEKLRETKFLSIKLQYNYNTRLLRHETAIICKFNSRRSSYATMEREQAIAIVFIIT